MQNQPKPDPPRPLLLRALMLVALTVLMVPAGIGIYVYWFDVRLQARVGIYASYAPDRHGCDAAYPILVETRNDTPRTVEKRVFMIEARERGEGTVVGILNPLAELETIETSLAPKKTFHECLSPPVFVTGLRRSYDLSQLDYEVVWKVIYFEK